MTKLKQRQLDFLKSVNVNDENSALRNSLVAAFKRNKIYAENASKSERKELHDRLRAELKRIGDSIKPKETHSEVDHKKAIKSLSACITKDFKGILLGGRFRIGTAQKALNLYLKFKWCLGELPKPIHCPLDGIILKKAKVSGAWTKLDNIDDYMDWISLVRLFVSKLNLPTGANDISTWELNEWRRE